MVSIAIHWFRRDLRLDDNSALHAALDSGLPVLPAFIFDANI
ncbi:deoxyribodipyrimidine photo-lyase, partial [bacterium]|nr:deoxyribodipyrimidine photo-lyase [bacterium]